MTSDESTLDQASRLRSAIQDACAHGGPCTGCQIARVNAVVKTIDRERTEAVREARHQLHDGAAPVEVVETLTDVLEGRQRDTELDTALTLLAKTHTVLRRAKTPRTDPAFLKDIAGYLAGHGIEVSDD